MPNETKYIFESPDGRTVYRREFGKAERELHSYRLDIDINHAIMVAGILPDDAQADLPLVYNNIQKSTDVWQIKPFLGIDANKKLGLDKLGELERLADQDDTSANNFDNNR